MKIFHFLGTIQNISSLENIYQNLDPNRIEYFRQDWGFVTYAENG